MKAAVPSCILPPGIPTSLCKKSSDREDASLKGLQIMAADERRQSFVASRLSAVTQNFSERATRAPGASSYACIVFSIGITAIVAAAQFGAAYKGVDMTAKCVLRSLENATGIDTNTNISGELLGVPLELLNLADSDFGAFEVMAVVPSIMAAVLYTVAILMVWCPNIPNPTCSKCIVGFANFCAFCTMIFCARTLPHYFPLAKLASPWCA